MKEQAAKQDPDGSHPSRHKITTQTNETRTMSSSKPDLIREVGLDPEDGTIAKADRDSLHRIIAVKLAAQGFDVPSQNGDDSVLDLAGDLFRVYREQSRLLDSHLCPIDQRVQDFLNDVLPAEERVSLPTDSLTVDRYGLARYA